MTFHTTGHTAAFDTSDLRHQNVFSTGKGPMGVAFQDAGTRAFICNHDEGSISVIDLGAMTIAGQFKTRMGPEMIACY